MEFQMRHGDMSDYMEEGRLLQSAYLLTGESSGALVDIVKPSVRAFYSFHRFGRLHNVLYDANCIELYGGKYGIYPYVIQNGREYLPFGYSGMSTGDRTEASYCSCEPEIVRYSEHEVSMSGVTLYNRREPVSKLPEFTVRLDGDALQITVQFPDGGENNRLHLPWYPLYDRYFADGKPERFVEYYLAGFYGEYYANDAQGYTENVGRCVELADSFSRQANLRLSGEGGHFELRSRTLPDMGHAKYLSTDFIAESNQILVTAQLKEQRVIFSGGHYLACGANESLSVRKDGHEEAVPISVSAARGAQEYVSGDGEEMARYHYCAVPTDDASMLDMMAKACLRLKWREGVCSGIPAKAFDAERMLPSLRENSAYCSHGMRILPLLCATAVRRREIDWVREAFDMVKKVAALSYHGADGMIYTPLQFDADGQPGAFGMASRPSDTGIIIGGLVYAADAFLRLGDEASAQECADYGWRYAKTLIRMQCENGEFYERYRYPSLEPSCGNRGTVNNWCMHVWNLQTILKRFGRQEEADALRNLASRYVDSQLTKSPSILKVCGGGEDVADFGDALNTASTLFTIKYILTGDEAYRKYTEQAMKKSWLMSCMYADMPEFFGIHGNSDLGIYYDQPNGIFSAGGMHDLTAIEAGLFAYHNLGIAFGRDLAERLYAARMSSFVKDNGAMVMVMLKCPNFFFREENRSEALMYGGVGVYAYDETTGGLLTECDG